MGSASEYFCDFVASAQGGTALHLFGAILGSQARIGTDTICHCVFAWWEHAGWTTKCAAADNQVTLAHGGHQGQEHGSAAAGSYLCVACRARCIASGISESFGDPADCTSSSRSECGRDLAGSTWDPVAQPQPADCVAAGNARTRFGCYAWDCCHAASDVGANGYDDGSGNGGSHAAQARRSVFEEFADFSTPDCG